MTSAGTVPVNTRAPTTRILCLGNDILADDMLGFLVADRLRQFDPPSTDIVSSAESGFHLLDYLLDVKTLVVIDTLQSGIAPPGTIHRLRPDQMQAAPGGSPHYMGLSETLTLARCLGLPVANDIIIFVVECSDRLAVGGAIHPAVEAAIPVLVSELHGFLRARR